MSAQPTSFRIAVVAHHDRGAMGEKLADEVGARFVATDTDWLNFGYWNHINAWKMLAKHPEPRDWCVVLEDDAVPVKTFREQLSQALDKAPGDLVSLYLGKGTPPQWQANIARSIKHPGAPPCWLQAPVLFSHVGVAIRHAHVNALITNAEYFLRRGYPIDEAISNWAVNADIKVSYTYPSLVDHRWDQPSVMKYRAHNGEVDLVERDVDPRNPRKAWWADTRYPWGSTVKQIRPPRATGGGKYVPF